MSNPLYTTFRAPAYTPGVGGIVGSTVKAAKSLATLPVRLVGGTKSLATLPVLVGGVALWMLASGAMKSPAKRQLDRQGCQTRYCHPPMTTWVETPLTTLLTDQSDGSGLGYQTVPTIKATLRTANLAVVSESRARVESSPEVNYLLGKGVGS